MIRRALVTAVVLALTVPALAMAAPHAQRVDARVPSAQLKVEGSGAMTVIGRMTVNGTIPERGQVVIIDRRGDAVAYLAGQPLEFTRKRATVRRASGILFVYGSNVSVQVLGVNLSFGIAGNGQARLLGSGTYQLNSGPERSWGRGVIKVSPSSAERRRKRQCANCFSPVVQRY